MSGRQGMMGRVTELQGLDDMLREWVVGVLADPKSRPMGVAVATWVNVGRPELNGLQQCILATYLIQMLLKQVDIDAEVVPAFVTLFDERSGKPIGVVGNPAPSWNKAGAWSGHCALWVPSHGMMLDPTIGQGSEPTGRTLLSRRPILVDAPQPKVGGSVVLPDYDYLAEYLFLETSVLPDASVPQMATLLRQVEAARATVGAQFRQVVTAN